VAGSRAARLTHRDRQIWQGGRLRFALPRHAICLPEAPPDALGDDMQRVKKVLLWVLVAFAAYAVFTSPDRAADILKTSGSMLADGAKSIGTFFDALLGR
jgi:hypothetical protein